MNVQHALDQANLLSGVRNDIESVFQHTEDIYSDCPFAAPTSPRQQTHYLLSEIISTVRTG